ncbi:hypothetical protein BU202_04945 [Streptococcus cuniculi]|uniref:Pneumococcal-type histidine triad protein n=1 Tax=Streptococcus cuniculi TaxID=1432788 RepID=A0A1Q8E7Q0_9STRE|nr:pneumococcal-type histidine triad protein [Streptococcus cuniculi]OLF47816.1 hypothetical protein BU202_04945 [Streptococcus cuniculi]
MKQKYIIGSVAVLALSLCSYELGRHQAAEKTTSNRVAYVQQANTSAEEEPATVEELTPEQVSAKENISAEQIVIKITDQGYVTSHGDHFHYYNGKVPYDAIISEELIMNDPAYQLQETDIVNEVKDGYIIKVNGSYYLYLKNKENPTNVRSKDVIAQQRHQHRQAQNKANRPVTGAVATAKQQGRYTTDDGYVFHPSDIVEDTGDAYIVPHGNHFHYIPKSDLSPDELRAAQAYWNRRNQANGNAPKATPRPNAPIHVSQVPHSPVGQPANPARPTPKQPDRPSGPATPIAQPVQPVEEEIVRLLKELYALPLSQRYVEEDGLVFDPVQITNRTDRGVVVPHGNHYHFIPYSKLSALEQKIAKMIPIGRTFPGLTDPKGVGIASPQKPATPTKPTKPTKPVQPPHSTTPEKPISDQPKPPSTGPTTGQASLLAPKKDVSPAYQEFYQAAYQLISSAARVLEVSKAEKTAYDGLNQLIKELNGEPTDKVRLTRAILAEIASVQYPERVGKPNSQIKYTAQELQVAKRAGMYTTSDGYIFDAKDIISDEGEGYLAPHMDHSHYIPKTDLSEKEQEEARRYVAEAGLADKKEEPASPTTGEKAIDIYNRVTAEKLIPVEKMPYHSAYVVDFRNGQMIIPHYDHYHNIPLSWFDNGDFEAPEGYTLEQFLATVKYYVLHPEDRPQSDDGFGSASDHGKVLEEAPEEKPATSETEEEDNTSEAPEEVDEYKLAMIKLAKEFGMNADDFENKLVAIVLKYRVSIENFSYQPEQKTVSLVTKSGRNVTISLETMAEVPVSE